MSYNAYKGYWFVYGGLPSIPKDFILINSKEITNTNILNYLLEKLKLENKKIESMYEFSDTYEAACFFVQLQMSEIIDYYFGKHKIYENKLYLIDMMGMTFWDYLKGDISFKKLMKELKKYNSQYIQGNVG